MIRLPAFDYYAPRTITESVDLLAAHPGAMLLAGRWIVGGFRKETA